MKRVIKIVVLFGDLHYRIQETNHEMTLGRGTIKHELDETLVNNS